MNNYTTERAVSFLQTLINQPLHYGSKSPDTDLFEFGFGNLVEIVSLNGEKRKCCAYILHVICRFKVIGKKKHQTKRYYEDTSSEEFFSDIQHLIGLKVKRVTLSDKNDLWLDLGDYWVVFATFENSEESWRYFTFGPKRQHLVASNSWLDFCEDAVP